MNLRTLALLLLIAYVASACSTDEAAAPTTQTPPMSIDTTGPPPEPVRAVGEPLRIIVDYSPTSSDVTALMYVTQHPEADLLAVTLAGTGESHCEAGVASTLALLAMVGRPEVPVACGQRDPVGPGNEWPEAWRDAADRLAGLDLDVSDLAVQDDSVDAPDLIASLAADAAPVIIVALGPLTNLAVAIERHDELAEVVAGVVTMGGAVDVEGNAPNDVAEWNYFIDPTAVDVVLRSGIPMTMVPLDATNAVPVTRAWFDALAGNRTTAAADVVHDLFEASRPFEFGFFFWDELAAATAFDPTLVTFNERPIVIELDGAQQGRTRVDAAGATVRIAVDADRERFEQSLLSTLNG